MTSSSYPISKSSKQISKNPSAPLLLLPDANKDSTCAYLVNQNAKKWCLCVYTYLRNACDLVVLLEKMVQVFLVCIPLQMPVSMHDVCVTHVSNLLALHHPPLLHLLSFFLPRAYHAIPCDEIRHRLERHPQEPKRLV